MNFFRLAVLSIILYYLYSNPVAVASSSPALNYSEKEAHNFQIINVHEHILDEYQIDKYKAAVKQNNISAIVLVGSPKEVLLKNFEGATGFTQADRNNKALLKISQEWPEMIYPFATFSPDDRHMLKKLKSFLSNGGKGLKLYNGHYRFYDRFQLPLDAPHMMKVFEFCQNNRVPIVFHANARYYWDELKSVLDSYPELTINLAHFCMSLVDLDKIALIFNTYPNVYSDISCGEGRLAYTTLEYISRFWKVYQGLVQTYKDRFLFATDMVLTDDERKNETYVTQVFECYRKMLENKDYTGVLIERYLEDNQIAKTRENSIFNGLQLDKDTLRHIYETNPSKFLGIPTP